MATEQTISKSDEVRALLASLNRTLEQEGFYLRSVHFDRDEQTDALRNIRLNYMERKEADHAD